MRGGRWASVGRGHGCQVRGHGPGSGLSPPIIPPLSSLPDEWKFQSPASFVAEGIWLKVMDCSPAVKGTQTVGEGAKTIRGDIGNVLCDVCGRCFRCCWPGSKPGTCQRPPRQCTGRGQAYCSTCVVSCWSQVSGKDEALMT